MVIILVKLETYFLLAEEKKIRQNSLNLCINGSSAGIGDSPSIRELPHIYIYLFTLFISVASKGTRLHGNRRRFTNKAGKKYLLEKHKYDKRRQWESQNWTKWKRIVRILLNQAPAYGRTHERYLEVYKLLVEMLLLYFNL